MPAKPNSKQIIAFTLVAAMMLIALAIPLASSAPTTIHAISEPKYGTSLVYVTAMTEFTLTASYSSDIWYKWGNNNYTKYDGPFNAVVYMETGSNAPPLPMDLDGLQTLYYNATGEAQNSVEVFVDNYHPVTAARIIGVNHTGDEYTYVSPDSGIGLSVSDPESGSGVEKTYYSINDGAYSTYTSLPFKLTFPGVNKINYFSMDNVGNREPDKILTVFLDDAPPVVEIVPGTPQAKVSGKQYISSATPISLFINDDSGVSVSSYSIDNGTWTAYSGMPFFVPGEGQRTVTARATDRMGHASSEISLIVHLDNTPPEAFIVDWDARVIRIEEGEAIAIGYQDAGVGDCIIRYSTDGGTYWNVYSSPLVLRTDTNLTFYAIDALGNTAPQKTVQLLISQPVAVRPWTFYLGVALVLGAVAFIAFNVAKSRRIPDKKAAPARKNVDTEDVRGESGAATPKKRKRNK